LCCLTSFEKKNPHKIHFTRTVQRLTVYEGTLEVVILKTVEEEEAEMETSFPIS
jgi:hypothetical protein